MSEPNAAPEIAVVGQPMSLTFESSKDMAGPVAASFIAHELTSDAATDVSEQPVAASWTETLDTKPAPGGAKAGTKRWIASWTAGVESKKAKIPDKTHLVRVVLRKSQGAGSTQAPALNLVRVPGIAVTDNPDLHEIMIHEFAKPSGASWAFDAEPLRAFIGTLTPEQRSLLCSYDRDRLVVFISLRGHKLDRPMYADNCGIQGTDRRRSVLSTADFSVFHCSKKGNRVVLVCHTEYFCMNAGNSVKEPDRPDTRKLLAAAYHGLSPAAKTPRKYLLAAEPHDLVVYMRLLNGGGPLQVRTGTVATGESVMGNNYIHGIVNTMGCWMLFRNYNWPIPVRDRFLSIYIRDYRSTNKEDVARLKLAHLGYDVETATATHSSSIEKWRDWDQNYAYSFFLERVVGIAFFSRSDFEDPPPYRPNLHRTHGHVAAGPAMQFDDKAFPVGRRFPGNSEGYDFHNKQKAAFSGNLKWKTNRDYVWQQNALGYKTARGWGYPFADCYIYNADGIALNELLKDPYVGLPATTP